ncbi:Cholesterol oxidase [Ensifer sp. M14]|uniref:alkaline phosphatase D family protein n=1 Tax=Ensifer sp. M14 TaxID=2203782 RepID=UPI000E1C9B37|nr:alkaline phosphatase D family protein [Ensifer sp. M14]RDL47058.1 Cholesterol oxidase [Ensifer sp. M14]
MTDLDTESKTAWISQGFERLVDRVRKAPAAVHFDVLIIGSGYGGAIAASTFAGRTHEGRPMSVGVLERGREYLPGSFPTGLGELPRHIRGDNNKEGLIDIRIGAQVVAVVASGVGGGSLINAGVMETPLPNVFHKRWPAPLKDLSAWKSYFDRARDLLGSTIMGAPNTIADHVDGVPQKFRSVRAIAPDGNFRPASITVAMSDTTSSGNVRLNKCLRCGDCATGCNSGAKNSLDVNLLVSANKYGAEIFSGATVLSLARDGNAGWLVRGVHTNAKLRKRDADPVVIRARKVVLAAGTLGSSEILMRSRGAGLQLADKNLGTGCSTNGDMLVADYATVSDVNTVADEAIKPSTRAIGPTTTGVIDLRASKGVMIEEMSVPAGLRIAFAEVFATLNTLHGLFRYDGTRHRPGFPDDDIYAAPAARVGRSALYAVMADDGAAGRIELDGDPNAVDRDGIARIRWDNLQTLPVFDRQVEALAALTKDTGGRLIPNPVWKLLPADLTWLLKDQRGPLVTFHPLGGCAMADSGAEGVVDHLGRVFTSADSDAVYHDLVVLDGSIVPNALATNPALTIAALALRAAEALAEEWNYVAAEVRPIGPPLVRPVFRNTDVAARAQSSEVEIIERLVGPISLTPVGGVEETRIVELTMRFAPTSLLQLTPSNGSHPIIPVATEVPDRAIRSQIRIFPRDVWETLETTWLPLHVKERRLDAAAEFSAPISGSLRIFERQPSSMPGRVWRAGKAWVLNRGLRDGYQALADGHGGPGLWSRLKSAFAIASRSGEIRTLTYNLTIGPPDVDGKIALAGNRIVGLKTLTYERRSNPWRQLMEMTLDTFPGSSPESGERVLKLDVGYLARIGVPLFRVANQRDGVNTIGELLTLFGFVTRLLLGLHLWSFRAPDQDKRWRQATVSRLPPTTLKLPGGASITAELHRIALAPERPDGRGSDVPGEVRLTRYRYPNSKKRPLIMFHGYCASGTTFAHHAVNPNFASHFWCTGRDIWIADLRTSAGQPTSTEAWSFDQIGNVDVPAALKAVAATSPDGTVDVIAHCMGAVVFSIAVLNGHATGLVNRAAFTQVGPLDVFAPANIFRAYLVRYLIDFLQDNYSFNPREPTLVDDLLDRLLSSLPYPVEEFDVENPLWPTKRTPWTRTRHRMDALCGRHFNVRNMEPGMLRYIDELFGPPSLSTVSSRLHFVRSSTMTYFHGHNGLVSRQNLAKYWSFPTSSVHGGENGLLHVSTVDRMRQIFGDAGRVYMPPFVIPGAGHQDELVGTKRHATLQQIQQFLDADIPAGAVKADSEKVVYPPWIGPILTEERPKTPALVIRLGAAPSHRVTEAALLLRVRMVDDRICRPDDPTQPWDTGYLLEHLVAYTSKALENDGWDAFEVPLLTRMPGHGITDRSDALLILLAYGDDAALAAPDLRHEELPSPLEPVVAPPTVTMFREPAAFPDLVGGLSAGPSLRTFDFDRSQALPRHAAQGAAYGYFVADSGQGRMRRLDPTGAGNAASGQAVAFAYSRFEKMAAAVERAIAFPSPNARHHGFTQSACPPVVEQDFDLKDGIVPYDPPAFPPLEPTPNGTSFALSSCQYPAGFLDEAVAYRGYGRIAERLEARAGIKPRFALFVGGQVYVDPKAGLHDPTRRDDRYRLPYEAWLSQSSVRNVLRQIPSFMLLDDQEIDDNWEPISDPDDDDNSGNAMRGIEAYRKYQRGKHAKLDMFDFDGFHFFMLDTRTQRTHRKVGDGLKAAAMFTPATMDSLKQWLLLAPGPKFVVSPAMLLPRHRRATQRDQSLSWTNLSALHSDGWDGYPNTLGEVLGYIAENRIEHVVFLSGDEHRACVATVDLFAEDGSVTRIHSIHTAAMFAPYPFANGIDEEIVERETIEVRSGARTYRCAVNATRPVPGDGATFLRVRRAETGWELDCEFGDGAVQTLVI